MSHIARWRVSREGGEDRIANTAKKSSSLCWTSNSHSGAHQIYRDPLKDWKLQKEMLAASWRHLRAYRRMMPLQTLVSSSRVSYSPTPSIFSHFRLPISFPSLDCPSSHSACGFYSSSSDYVVALNTAQYGDTSQASPWCGRTITINANGKSAQGECVR